MFRQLLKYILVGVAAIRVDDTELSGPNWYDPCTAKGYLGDIALNDADVAYFNRTRSRRAATNEKERIWPGAVIPFAFRPNWDARMIKMFFQAMRNWEHVTCVQFVPAKPGKAYILFAERPCGCCSYVGKQRGNMPQGLSIGRGCDQSGTVLHELGHAVGFWHEMSRPDRDDFIDVRWDNIKDLHKSNFDIEANIDSLGESYDPYSIMHYGTYFFTSNGRKTIRLKNIPENRNFAESQMGQRSRLSESDIRQANSLHKCRQKCGRQIDASDWLGEVTHNNVFKRTVCEWRVVPGPSGNVTAQIEVQDGFRGRIRMFDGAYKADNGGLQVFDSKVQSTITLSVERLVMVIFYVSGEFSVKLEETCGHNTFIEPGKEELLFPAYYPYQKPQDSQTIPCNWTLSTREQHILELSFRHFRVEPNELTVDTNNGTRLRIFNGIRSRWTPPTIASYESMKIDYQQLDSRSEFVLEIKAKPTKCTVNNGGCEHMCVAYGELDEPICYCAEGYLLQPDGRTCKKNCVITFSEVDSGAIENNNFGKADYDHNQFCEWSFNYPPGYAIVFDNFTINIEDSVDCSSDYLLIGKSVFCGFAVIPDPIQLEAGEARVTFKSNENIARSGFHFSFRVLSPIDRQCEIDNGGCSGSCQVVDSQVQCSCFSDSFELDTDGKTCVYINDFTSTWTSTTTSTTTTTTTTTKIASTKELA